MRAGQGKKHGRFSVGDGLINPTSAPTLSQVRARSTDSSPAIRVRPNTTQFVVQGLEERLDNETRRREAVEAQVEELRLQHAMELQATREQQEAERVAANQKLAEVLAWVGVATGKPPPEALLSTPPRPGPPHSTTAPSSASNDPTANQDTESPHCPPRPPSS